MTHADLALPLSYRPLEFDDWGIIRDANGHIFCQVKWPVNADFDLHRRNGTDPYEAAAKIVIDAINRPTPTPADGMLDPEMPTQELRLHMGELTASEIRVARAAIAWANSALSRAPVDVEKPIYDIPAWKKRVQEQFIKEMDEGGDPASGRDLVAIEWAVEFILEQRLPLYPPASSPQVPADVVERVKQALKETQEEIKYWHNDMLTQEEHPRGNGWKRVYGANQEALEIINRYGGGDA